MLLHHYHHLPGCWAMDSNKDCLFGRHYHVVVRLDLDRAHFLGAPYLARRYEQCRLVNHNRAGYTTSRIRLENCVDNKDTLRHVVSSPPTPLISPPYHCPVVVILQRITNLIKTRISLWVVKLSVGIYLTRLIDQFWAAKAMLSNSSGGRIIKTFLSNYCNSMFYISLVVSFVGVCLSELIECRPFSHYWQVAPDPGPACRQAYGQLFTMGAFNILTDLILIALPLPLIIEAKLARKVKLESLLLMLFPLVNICFTTYRLPSTVSSDHLGSQRYRTFMASLDILLSTASANALVVTSFLQGRGFKKTTTYKHPELEGQQEDETALQQHQHHHGEDDVELKSLGHINTTAGLRLSARSSLGDRHSQAIRKRWGSDEDLMRDDFGVGESTPPTLVPKRMSSQIIFDEGDALPVADGCSERSTTRLSPWPLAETSISADKTAIHAMAEIGDGSGDIAMPRQARRASAVKGIVVETTWHVDVSRSS